MNRLIRHAALRFYLRHPGQLLLAIAGIALGVAVVVAVDLANDTSLRAFELSRELTTSRASHVIEAAAGTLPDSVYRVVKVDVGVDRAAPIVQGRVAFFESGGNDDAGESMSLLGIDPVAELAFDQSTQTLRGADGDEDVVINSLIARPGTVLLPESLAARRGLTSGDEFLVTARGVTSRLRVGALITLAAGRGSGETGPIITDITTAQEVLDHVGRLTRIELTLSEGEAVTEVADALPTGVTIIDANAGNDVTSQMLRAFRINLTALSLLALVVGMLLIYATMSFAVVQRRRSLGTLRALGATRSDVAHSVLVESLVLGTVATAIGLLLGYALSRALIELVLATINDLYFETRVASAGSGLWSFIKAGTLGVGATTLAALQPAVEAAREPARTAMTLVAYEQGMRRRFAAAPYLAVAALLAGAAFIALPGDALLPAFAGLFCVLAGYALLVPTATAALLQALLIASRGRLGVATRLALRGAVASLSRTAIAVTALTVAVATVVGIGVMIDSFRSSVTVWLDDSLIADYYLVTLNAGDDGFGPTELAELRTLPGIAGLSLSRTLTLATPAGDVAIRAAGVGPSGYGEKLVAGDPATAFEAIETGDAIILSEPFARLRGLAVGDTLALPSPQGLIDFRVVGVFRDYRTRDSAAMLPYKIVSDVWGYRDPIGVGVYARKDADRDALGAALGDIATGRGNTQLAANDEIRRITLDVFDRTFEITGVLRLLAGIIAFFGILSALLALQLERRREIATLRAIGFTRHQTGANSLVQTTLLGLVAGLLALPLGVTLAALLIYVINERSFGWSMGFFVAPGQVGIGLVLAVLAAFIAGLYPARRLAGLSIAANLRGE